MSKKTEGEANRTSDADRIVEMLKRRRDDALRQNGSAYANGNTRGSAEWYGATKALEAAIDDARRIVRNSRRRAARRGKR